MTELVTRDDALRMLGDVPALLAAIETAFDVDDLKEARARVKAAMAWAQAHGKIREHRRQLLRLEAAALRRIAELGHTEVLNANDRATAKYLSELTVEEIESVLDRYESLTSASGVVRVHRAEEEQAAHRQEGRDAANNPPPPHDYGWEHKYGHGAVTQSRVEQRRDNVAGLLEDLLAEFTSLGEPFTVEDVYEAVADRAFEGHRDSFDEALHEGLREVIRRAINGATPARVHDKPLPRTITYQMDSGRFIRVPTAYARIGHLDGMICLREKQLEQDKRALDALREVRDVLLEIAADKGANVATVQIGELAQWTLKTW